MNLTYNAIIDVFSILVLAIIHNQSRRQADRRSPADRVYILMLRMTVLMLSLDIFSRFDGKPETIYPVINQVGNFLIFFLSPVLPSLWLVFVCWQICRDLDKIRLLRLPLIVVLTINGILTSLSLSTGWYYSIDQANIYQRGPLFLVASSFSIILILTAFIITLVKRKQIEIGRASCWERV